MSALEVQAIETVRLLIRPGLIGVWTLRSFIDTVDGSIESHPLGPEPKGLLIYTEDGFVSAQLMNPARAPLASGEWNRGTREEYVEIGGGYIGYCGRFEVDEEHSTVFHLPEISFFPNFIGRKQRRSVNLLADRLVLTTHSRRSDGIEISSRLEWVRGH